MSNRIKSFAFNNELPSNAKAIFKKFPGAISNEINDYSKSTIRKDTPKGLIIISGANDCSYKSKNRGQPNPNDIANDIISIGMDAKRLGVKNIFISGLIHRSTWYLDRLRKQVNKHLYDLCIANQFYYIDNDDIGEDHLCDDGLHLNSHGGTILKHNLLRCFDESLYIY